MPDEPAEPGEQFVIETLLRGRTIDPRGVVSVDIGDDTAVLLDGTLVTTDTLVEGVHWDHRATMEDVGWKSVATSVSDIASMGGKPTWATLSISMPRPIDRAAVEQFTRGFHAACSRWGVTLVGGDTTRSPGPMVVTVTLAGHARTPLLRSGASPGDDIWVTGVPGEAAAGFAVGGPGLSALHRPVPPVEFAIELAEQGLANAAMDLSDGIAQDLIRLCRASSVGASVDPSALPSSPILRSAPDPLQASVAFGDDYQLLFTAPPQQRALIEALATHWMIRVTRIGAIESKPTVRLLGCPWPKPTFSHFGPTQTRQTGDHP